MEQTVVLVKPDALQRGLIGEIVHRFEIKGLKIVGMKMMSLSDETLDEWYVHHKDKSFFSDLKGFMKSAPIIAMVWQGYEAISAVRKIVGVTKGREAEGGSIRGDFSMSGQHNIIHASDSSEAAKKEIGLIFTKNEIFEYESPLDNLIYSKDEWNK